VFLVIYGRTKIPKDELIGIQDYLSRSGNGVTLGSPSEDHRALFSGEPQRLWAAGVLREDDGDDDETRSCSRNFQWLPCDVKIDGSDNCRIVSYTNNLIHASTATFTKS
jgi:hypothetical protein